MRTLIAFFGTLILTLILMVQFPARMIQPGKLSEGHAKIANDCASCHVWLKGASVASCTRCHDPAQIGRRSTTGALLPAHGVRKIPFHASLASTDCMACHTLHRSERARPPVAFRHDLLAAADRNECQSCHAGQKPKDALHAKLQTGCAACHSNTAWRPASLDHARLPAGASCASCHEKDRPRDDLHAQSGVACASCHQTSDWRPATFEHAKFFRFDGNHPADCRTCHTDRGTFSTYTCYGCHEHSPGNIAAEHREEGIRNFDNCASCHRSGQEGEGEGGGEGGRGRRGGREGEEDDD